MHAHNGCEQRGHDRAAAQRSGLLDALARGARARGAGDRAPPFRRRRGRVPGGRRGHTCYVVRSGRARAVREHPDGRSITLAHFGAGDIFGELAMFDDERRSATVEAIEDTEVIAILGADMQRLLREHSGHLGQADRRAGRRLRETNERLARQSFQTVQSRVRRGARGAGGDGAREGGAERRRAHHRHPGRPGAAGGLLAGVGQPLPGGARARRSDHPGSGKADRPRPGALGGYVY